MKNVRCYRKSKNGELYCVWKFVLDNDMVLEIDNMLEPDGPDFVEQFDNHLVRIKGVPS
jgi:hypothetical protein